MKKAWEEIVGLKIEVNRQAESRILMEEQLEKMEETNTELAQQITEQKKTWRNKKLTGRNILVLCNSS